MSHQPPEGPQETPTSQSCVSAHSAMLGKLHGAAPSGRSCEPAKGSTEGSRQDPSSHCPMAQGSLWEPILIASARGMPSQTTCPSRQTTLSECAQATVIGVNWPFFSVSAALIGLVNPTDCMVLFNEDPNLPKSQFKQRHL